MPRAVVIVPLPAKVGLTHTRAHAQTAESLGETVGRAGFDAEPFYDPHLSEAAPLLEELRTKAKKLRFVRLWLEHVLSAPLPCRPPHTHTTHVGTTHAQQSPAPRR